jgi:hypothetical protein
MCSVAFLVVAAVLFLLAVMMNNGGLLQRIVIGPGRLILTVFVNNSDLGHRVGRRLILTVFVNNSGLGDRMTEGHGLFGSDSL